MYLEKPLSAGTDDSYDLVCLKNDEALRLIILYVERDLVHHTMGINILKYIWDSFHTLFGAVNTTQVSRLETELPNLKMVGFATIDEYIARFKNLKVNILASSGKFKTDTEYISTILNNLSSAFKDFAIIYYSITLFIPTPTFPTLDNVFFDLI